MQECRPPKPTAYGTKAIFHSPYIGVPTTKIRATNKSRHWVADPPITMAQGDPTIWQWGAGRRRISPLGNPSTATYSVKRGVFGGTFDPPHIGHLVLAEAARSELGLSEVVFMPAAQPPHKQDKKVTPTVHRVEMVKRAISSNGQFALSTLDAERSGPSYTVDSMRLLREVWGSTVEIVFIMGLDSLVQLGSWYQVNELLKLVTFAVVARPGYHADMASLERAIPGVIDRVIFVPAPLIGISSTAIRQRVQHSDSIRYLVPPSVERYIYEQELYQEQAQVMPKR